MGANVTIKPATPDVWPAIEGLFMSASVLRGCWCQWFRRPSAGWGRDDPERNRAALRAQVDDEPLAPGLVAFRDGQAVGWVAVGPREGYPRLVRSRTIPQLPGEDVWVVSCFVVLSGARSSGVATALLDAAVAYAAAHDARTVEGYPVDNAGAHLPPGAAYTGTAAMFKRAGFTVASQTGSNARPGMPRVVVRRTP